MSDDRPKLRKGRGTPLAGPSPRTTEMLSRAWTPMRNVNPAAASWLNRFGAFIEMTMPRQTMTAKRASVPSVPMRPEFLADDGENEIGVGAGKEEQLLDALAEADAEQAARDPTASLDWATWKLRVWRFLSGERKARTRSSRYSGEKTIVGEDGTGQAR